MGRERGNLQKSIATILDCFGGMYELPNNIHSIEQLGRWVENTSMHHVFLIKRNLCRF